MTRRQLVFPGMASYMASELAAVDYCNEVVDGAGRLQHLDKVVSVSGLDPDPGPFMIWNEVIIDEQERSFLNSLERA